MQTGNVDFQDFHKKDTTMYRKMKKKANNCGTTTNTCMSFFSLILSLMLAKTGEHMKSHVSSSGTINKHTTLHTVLI